MGDSYLCKEKCINSVQIVRDILAHRIANAKKPFRQRLHPMSYKTYEAAQMFLPSSDLQSADQYPKQEQPSILLHPDRLHVLKVEQGLK